MNLFYKKLIQEIPSEVTLVAVSKTRSIEEILELYNLGQRDFGENKVQELVNKYQTLPKDINWHMIGHLQANKVKQIAPFIHLIHSVDSFKLATEVNKEAQKFNRIIPCLIQIKISEEESKYGLTYEKAIELEKEQLNNVSFVGYMGMASNTEDNTLIKEEFNKLNEFFLQKKTSNNTLEYLSMGMSGDYKIALESGSNMLRIGSLLF